MTEEIRSKNPRQCRNCQSTNTECFHKEVGGVDFLDEYTLVCKVCGHISSGLINGGTYDNWHTNCPFCGESSETHRSDSSEGGI